MLRKKPEEVRARLRYAYAEERANKWPVKALGHALGVSESGYYRYHKNKGKPKRDKLLSVAIKGILDEHPWNDNYGVQRMRLALAQRGVRAGVRRLTRLMREHGWLHERKRSPKGLTKADPAAMKSENLIKQDFSAALPFQKLLTDITQVQCADGKLYISPILDCFNGKILSLRMVNNSALYDTIAFNDGSARLFANTFTYKNIVELDLQKMLKTTSAEMEEISNHLNLVRFARPLCGTASC